MDRKLEIDSTKKPQAVNSCVSNRSSIFENKSISVANKKDKHENLYNYQYTEWYNGLMQNAPPKVMSKSRSRWNNFG